MRKALLVFATTLVALITFFVLYDTYYHSHALIRVLYIVEAHQRSCTVLDCYVIQAIHTGYNLIVAAMTQFLIQYQDNWLLGSHITSAFFSALYLAASFFAIHKMNFSRGWTIFLTLASFLAAPGIVLEIVSTEDNVSTYAFVVLFLFFLLQREENRDSLPFSKRYRKALLAGLFLSIGAFMQIQAFVFVFMIGAAPFLWWLGDKDLARRVCVACGTAFILSSVGLSIAGTIFKLSPNPIETIMTVILEFRNNYIPKPHHSRLSVAHVDFIKNGLFNFLGSSTFYADSRLYNLVFGKGPFFSLAGVSLIVLRALLLLRSSTPFPKELLRLALLCMSLALAYPLLYETNIVQRYDQFWLCFFFVLLFVFNHDPKKHWVRPMIAIFLIYQMALGIIDGYRQPFFSEKGIAAHQEYQSYINNLSHAKTYDAILLPFRYARFDGETRTKYGHFVRSTYYLRVEGETSYFYSQQKQWYSPLPEWPEYDEEYVPKLLEFQEAQISKDKMQEILGKKRFLIHPESKAVIEKLGSEND